MKLIAFLFKKLIFNLKNTFEPDEDGGYSKAQVGLGLGLVIVGVMLLISLISKI